MLKPLPMKYVVVQVLTEDLPGASLALAEIGSFNPDHRDDYREAMPLVPGEEYREVYRQAETRLEKIRSHIALAPNPRISEVREMPLEELRETNEWLGRLWERCSAVEEALRDLAEEERMVAQLEEALHNFAHLDIDLGRLQGDKLFLETRIGSVARANLEQLRGALELAGFLLYPYMQLDDNAHVIVVGPKGEDEGEFHGILDTAGFRHLPIPPELHDEPDDVRRELDSRREQIETHRQRINRELRECAQQVGPRLEESRVKLLLAEPYVMVDQAVHSSGALSILTGWMPEQEIPRAQAVLKSRLQYPFNLEVRDPLPDEMAQVPSHSPRGGVLTPFSVLVSQYGVPRYGEIDPTPLFALSFIAMFGMMFGDIGHGLTIIVAALFARKLLKSFTIFAVLAGCSATLFGFLYGSIFGYEHILHAVWIPPLSDPLYMLSMALIWGVGFLLLISLLAIYNRLAAGRYSEAVFETNGVMSLLLYLSVIGGLYTLYRSGSFSTLAGIIAVICLIALLGYKLIETEAPPAERIMVAVIETFETLTGYISNTLSFLRVAAFSLNHVALAIAVFTLADMMDTTGHWVMVVFGNLFILVLEGAIVTIQALRLEYYEGFSRFYSGDGRRFKPLRLGQAG